MSRFRSTLTPLRGVNPSVVASLLLALVAATVFPSQAALFDDNVARRQIAAERQRVDEANARIEAQTKLLESVVGRLGKLEESAGRNQAVLELFREIENLKSEIAKMRGQLEVLGNGIETAQKRQQDFYVDLDTRLRRIETLNPPAVSGAAPADPNLGPSGGASTTVSGKPAASARGRAGATRVTVTGSHIWSSQLAPSYF